MINYLSSKCKTHIAIFFAYLFLINGTVSFANSNVKNYVRINYTTPNNYNGSNDSDYSANYKNLESLSNTKKERNEKKLDNIKEDEIKNLGGPSQPEMAAFKPVGADNMVDLFSGDFSYNIPLLDVGGYPVNIFYNSNITMDQEASWAGLGWNINPGTISRNMRGIPDDFNGEDKIEKVQYTKPERTYGLTASGSVKGFPIPLVSLSANFGLFYNNMRGIGAELGISPAISIGVKNKDLETSSLSLGWGLQANSQTGGSSSFSISLNKSLNEGIRKGSLTASLGYHSRMGLQSLHLSAEASKNKAIINNNFELALATESSFNPTGATMSFAFPAITPSIRSKMEYSSHNLNLGLGPSFWGVMPNFRLKGYYTETAIPNDAITTKNSAYGMLFMQDAVGKKDALMDFNRLNEGIYTSSAPTTSMPVYTYDVFTISGEGTGGSFKAQRADLGYVNDPTVETGGQQISIGADLGGGSYAKFGLNGNAVLTPSVSGVWSNGNLAKNALAFKKHDGLYRSVYFRNPGEKAIQDNSLQTLLGNDDLVRFKMTNLGYGNPTLLPTLVHYDDQRNIKTTTTTLTAENTKKQRDKRTQVISFLSAEEADRAGLNKLIPSVKDIEENAPTYYGVNHGLINYLGRSINSSDEKIFEPVVYRKPHHISEISVLQSDGKRYIYDIPVYNVKQVDVTFNSNLSKNTVDASTQTVSYQPGFDNVERKNEGKDGFVEKQTMPAYTHSFLLSSLLSSNYVDVTGNGITEDDLGDAIKFNYSNVGIFKWRTPHALNSATYSEGVKLNKDDDKSHYIYGEREMWYLHTIESKNMVARFYSSSNRRDGKSALGETGGRDDNWGSFKLEKISLFSKADLAKENADNTKTYKAKPIKTVHFEYDYSLCGNVPDNDGKAVNKVGVELTGTYDPSLNVNANKGKLTLRRIYFTYNGNNKSVKNSYRFNYGTNTDKNPNYDYTANDRWGNYKPSGDNPAGLKNGDYPYVIQDKTKADSRTAAWALNEVKLPSGGSINVEYESDDYAYVQDRRANNMFQIAGFGKTPLPINSSQLYNTNLYEIVNQPFTGISDNEYLYIKVFKQIKREGKTDIEIKQQIKDLYLGNFDKTKQVFMKLAVNVPTGSSTATEMIPIYGEIEDYGLVKSAIPDALSNSFIYLKIKKLESGYTPMTQFALQFMKNNLPKIAYPASDLSETGGIESIIKALAGVISSMGEIFNDQMYKFKRDGKCKTVNLQQSLIRLTDPNLTKFGGGLRVKKIIINDNFDQMTKSAATATDGMQNSTYGQEYSYTKTELINNQLQTISSGVAQWEPSIGGEENPHREMINYFNKNNMGPYDFATVELPLAEMLFPSPSVGYSKITVKSINNEIKDATNTVIGKVKNAASIQVTDYFTAREFPTKSNYTPLEEHGAKDEYKPNPLLSVFSIDIQKAVSLSQGFKVETNNMHGQLKKQATYSPLNLVDPISYTENFYSIKQESDKTYKINHQFKVLNDATGKVTETNLGKDIELMTDFREHQSQTITINPEFNVDVLACLFPIPIPTFFSPFMMETTTFRSASTTKVINHYGTLDSVVAVDKGSMVSTRNLVYDAQTGEVLLTRTQNEHNNPIYNFNYPAHWAYEGMGFAYKNIDAAFSGLEFRNGRMSIGMSKQLMDQVFENGDELYVVSKHDRGPDYNPTCENPNVELRDEYLYSNSDNAPIIGNVEFYVPLAKNPAERIWAINTSKANSSTTPDWYFIDRNGKGYTAKDAYIRVIRSGKRNMPSSSVGSITLLNNPIDNNNNIVLNSTAKVLQTAAATYKDNWRVEDEKYLKHTDIEKVELIYPNEVEFVADEVITANETGYGFGLQKNSLVTTSIEKGSGFKLNFTSKIKSWLRFNGLNTFLNSDIDENGIFGYPIAGTLKTPFEFRPILNIFSYAYGSVPKPTTCNNYFAIGVHPDYNITPRYNQNASEIYSGRLFPFGNATILQPMHSVKWFSESNLVDWQSEFRKSDNFSPISNMSESDFYSAFAPHLSSPVGWNVFLHRYEATNIIRKWIKDKKNGLEVNPAFVLQNFQMPDNINKKNYKTMMGLDNCQTNYLAYAPKLKFLYYNTKKIKSFRVPGIPELGAYSSVITRTSECISKYTNTETINPYVQGIWGNWRADISYVYYGDRENSNITSSSALDTRTAGAIANFKPFWNFATSTSKYISKNDDANDVWVWNSAATQFNRKGYDIENKDPLGRYNAGLYGYNQQLPVAVVNNSRYRESMFDGFEDYDYSTLAKPAVSNSIACGTKRHGEITKNSKPITTSDLSAEQKHSGKSSLKLLANETAKINVAVVNPLSETNYGINIGVTSTLKDEVTISNPDPSKLCTDCNNPAFFISQKKLGYYTKNFKKILQAPITGKYYFKANVDDGLKLTIGTLPTVIDAYNHRHEATMHGNNVGIDLVKGQSYDLSVEYINTGGDADLQIMWRHPGISAFEYIPNNYLFEFNTPPNNVTRNQVTCTSLGNINVSGNALTDNFTLIPGKKMVLSAWVKEGNKDCTVSEYLNNQIDISFTGATTTTISSQKAKGPIIEGWQRYEIVFTVPAGATNMEIVLKAGSSDVAFFDDIRIHPYNANMKSFVYHPNNLRLMAELDENNYATFYEYDDDGTLTRLKKETIRGVKTIKETRSALQKATE